ncbi:MAG: TetR family transcriptional regulator [Casimicrobiaceae bacterium]
MARRTKAAAAVTREHLLDAAQRVFREHGVTRTSLAEVATAAGVTRGAVYWHFKDKAALFTAMCDRATLPLDAMLEAAGNEKSDDPLDALRRLMVGALQYLANDARTQAVFEVIFHKTELCGALGEAAGCRDRERSGCLRQVEKLVRQAAASGQLPADTDAALATHLLHASISGLMREWVLDPGAYDLARVAPALADCIIAGLVAQSPRTERVLPRVRPRATAAA